MSLKEKFAELKHVVANALHYADPTALIEKATQALIESLVDTVHTLQERVEVLEKKLEDALATNGAPAVVQVGEPVQAAATDTNATAASGASVTSQASSSAPGTDAPAVAASGEIDAAPADAAPSAISAMTSAAAAASVETQAAADAGAPAA